MSGKTQNVIPGSPSRVVHGARYRIPVGVPGELRGEGARNGGVPMNRLYT
ncbi:hypothetical protein [Erwinia endophytica]|nr:hypothetical protein [Erwinia endophytica]